VVVHLRAIDRSDGPRLARLLDQLGYPTSAADLDARLDDWLDDAASALIGAELDRQLVGVAALHVVPILEVTGKVGRLVALVVDDSYRGRGVGTALVRAAEQRAQLAGCIMMEVTSNRGRVAAHGFYVGVGYADACPTSARFTRFLDPPGSWLKTVGQGQSTYGSHSTWPMRR
jgi:GNAT superfamily N-acetyltransferase